MPGVDGNAKRDTSGRGGSILITSAPRSSKVRAQSRPARTREKSTTRIPESGPLMSAPHEFGEAGAVLAERSQTDLEVFGSPDRLLDLGHRFVRCEHTSLTAMCTRRLVAACATVGPCASSWAIVIVASSSASPA